MINNMTIVNDKKIKDIRNMEELKRWLQRE